jgi:hypothetical protein
MQGGVSAEAAVASARDEEQQRGDAGTALLPSRETDTQGIGPPRMAPCTLAIPQATGLPPLGTNAQTADDRPQIAAIRAASEGRRQLRHSAWECGSRPSGHALAASLHTREVAGSKPAAPII